MKALGGGGWSPPRYGRFTPGKRLGIHYTGDWVGPMAGTGAENFASIGIRSSDCTGRSYTDCAIPGLHDGLLPV